MQPTIIFDGHDALTGIQGGNPVTLGTDKVANSVNRFYRDDRNRTRPPFRELTLTFADLADQTLFRQGNLQGAFFYTGRPPTSNIVISAQNQLYFPNYLIAAIGGAVFAIMLQGSAGVVTRLPATLTPNNPLLLHTWFAQGYEWLFIQNGEQNALVWNGQDTSQQANYFRADPALNQVPVGSVMAFIYGMLVVTSADGRNQIAVGNQAYSDNQTNSSDILSFTDSTYWAEGGYFDIAADLGDIMGAVAMPYLDTGSGQNELVVLCRNGGTSFDFSGARTTWLDTQVQRICLIGMGCVSSHSLALLNGDLIYKGRDGIRSYQNSRIEFEQGYNQSPLSYDVDRWIRQENQALFEFNCQVAWNNMLFSSVMPMMQPCALGTSYGYHRYHRGMLAYDCQPQSRIEGGNPSWQGLWTGPRPTAFADGFDGGIHRAFCFSFDTDGQNRVYEFQQAGDFDISNGLKKSIVSMYDTPSYCGQSSSSSQWAGSGANRFSHKRLFGCNIELSDIRQAVQFAIQYRPDGCPCFIPWKEATIGCDCADPADGNGPFQQPSWSRRDFGNPSNQCAPGSTEMAAIFRSAQYRVTLTGAATVDRLGILMQAKEQVNRDGFKPTEVCIPPDQCCPATDEFRYSFPFGDSQGMGIVKPVCLPKPCPPCPPPPPCPPCPPDVNFQQGNTPVTLGAESVSIAFPAGAFSNPPTTVYAVVRKSDPTQDDVFVLTTTPPTTAGFMVNLSGPSPNGISISWIAFQ